MAKSRKRKHPVTKASYDSLGHPYKSVSGHDLIRRFHVLLKRRELLVQGTSSTSHELNDIENEIDRLGGLEAYQRVSAKGQSEERGGGSERIFVEWLKDIRGKAKGKLRLLEVGALKHDNYLPHATWIDCTPIDLRSRHPLIQEQDFLKMDAQAHRSQWDAISMSLVLNFVPNPHDRGKMLKLAHEFLREGGHLFLALPLPCVANSRYLDFDRLRHIMALLGFVMLKERWKHNGKMAYWLYQKDSGVATRDVESCEPFTRKAVLRDGKNRNNFAILL